MVESKMELKEEIKKILTNNKIPFVAISIPYGIRLRVFNGCIINIYNTGKYFFQGKNIDKISNLININLG